MQIFGSQGTDLALRSSVFFPAFLQTLYMIVGKLLSLVHSFHHPQKGWDPPASLEDLTPTVTHSWEELGKSGIKGL